MKIVEVRDIQIGERWVQLTLLKAELGELFLDSDLSPMDYYGDIFTIREVKESEIPTNL